MSTAEPRTPSGEPSVWPYLSLLLRRRRLIVLLPLALAALVATYSLTRTRAWEASARFMPQETSVGTSASLNNIAAQFGLPSLAPISNAASSPAFYAELLQSEPVLHDVLRSRYQVQEPEPWTGDLLDYFLVPPSDSNLMLIRGTRSLRRSVGVTTDRVTGLVELVVQTGSPELSVQIARRFLDLISEYNLDRRQSAARAEREFVGARLAEVRDSLHAAEQALSGFYSRNRMRDAPALIAEEQRLQRAVDIQQQLYVGLAQRYETARIEEVRNTPVVTVVEPPEGMVMPVGRGTVRKTFLALVLGGVLAVGVSLLQEMLAAARRAHAHDYAEFKRLEGEAVKDLGAVFRVRGVRDRASS